MTDKFREKLQLNSVDTGKNVENTLDIEKIVEKIQSNEGLKVRLFKKIDGEAQKGYLFYPEVDGDFVVRDCEIHPKNEMELETGDYPVSDFEEVVIMAPIMPFDAPSPPPLPSKTFLRLKKDE